MDMVLAKSDIAIASRYAELVADAELRDAIFPRLRAEWQGSIDALLAITGSQRCSSGNPLLARSIKYRFPYLDPLNHMQIELLKRHRAGDAGRARRAGHPPDHQRHRGGLAQQRVSGEWRMVLREIVGRKIVGRKIVGRKIVGREIVGREIVRALSAISTAPSSRAPLRDPGMTVLALCLSTTNEARPTKHDRRSTTNEARPTKHD